MDSTYGRSNIFRGTLFAIALFWTYTPRATARFTPYAKAVSPDSLPSLVFQKWKLTNYRRNEPVYQLKCVSGCEFEPDWVKCFNAHSPLDKRPGWRCEADLPGHLQFSTLEVICEGYESKDDNSILEGSCGLEYSLKHAMPSSDLRPTKKNSKAEVKECLCCKSFSGSTAFLFICLYSKSDSQWGTCQWFMLTIVIYVCCYYLYQVVQSDLKEAPNTTYQNTAEPPLIGRCGKCQSTRFSLPRPLKEKYYPELHGWQSDTTSECQKSNERVTNPFLGVLSPTCNSPMRESYPSPPKSPRSPRGGFFKKLDRPSRWKKREDFESPRT